MSHRTKAVSYAPEIIREAGQKLAAGAVTGDVYVWDALTGHELLRMSGHTSTVRAVAWSPDGRRLASGSNDRSLKVWDTATGTEILTLGEYFLRGVYTVAWSPDGRQLATDGEGLFIWDAQAAYETAREEKKRGE